jgi:hypothetical protein
MKHSLKSLKNLLFFVLVVVTISLSSCAVYYPGPYEYYPGYPYRYVTTYGPDGEIVHYYVYDANPTYYAGTFYYYNGFYYYDRYHHHRYYGHRLYHHPMVYGAGGAHVARGVGHPVR